MQVCTFDLSSLFPDLENGHIFNHFTFFSLSTSRDGNDENYSDSENAAAVLTESYQGAIEFLFEIGTWLTYIDENPQQARDIIESVVMETILQNYDRTKTLKFFDSGNAYVSYQIKCCFCFILQRKIASLIVGSGEMAELTDSICALASNDL